MIENLIKEINILNLKKDDIIILKMKDTLNDNMKNKLTELLEPIFTNNKIIILENEASIEIFRKEN
jgi:hypothetical protein